MRRLKMMVRGLGDLPGCGAHPGLPVFGAFVGVAAVHGLIGGGIGPALVGAAVMCLGLGPFMLYGAYRRARYEEGGK